MIFSKYLHDLSTALEALMANKMKSFLTALGILFGVAAVISMLAIGKGAKKEILEQIKLVGVNNIVITPIIEDPKKKQNNQEDKEKTGKFSRALTLSDEAAIREILPAINKISPEIFFDTYVIQNGKRKPAKLLGVTPEYFELFNYKISEGQMFSEYQQLHSMPVCIIGSNIKILIFNKESPINKYIKCGQVWLKVTGVLEKQDISSLTNEKLGINSSDGNIYVPIRTMLMRYVNRSQVTSALFQEGFYSDDEGSSGQVKEKRNFNQLDRLVVQVSETPYLKPTRDVIERLLLRRHSGVKDFEVTIPELLLKQQQRTKDIFNIVLGAIAGISLLVGGIGIMNIMLASVMERIREIGTRQALGATKRDIIVQFLAESTLISLSGGFIGIIAGIIIAKLITKLAGILTIISPLSVLIAFGISVAVGIIFGYMPAKKAAERDPIESLRYE
jgi:putative ABC transport system permease protein